MPPKPKPIDVEQLEKLAEKLWSIEQIAAFFKVSRDTIERRFAAKIKECRQLGTARIRDLQWKRALEGSDTMIKHLAEHHLDEHTKTRNENEIKGGIEVRIVDYGTKPKT